jgi:four helix bundle protein
MHSFKNLIIWKESVKLTVEVYKVTTTFPSDEKYGLISQIRRAVVSIPSNIAEGSSRASDKDFLRFLSISLGSAFELETQLILAQELRLTDFSNLEKIINKLSDIQKMIIGLQNKIDNKNYLVNEDAEEYIILTSKF